MSGAQVLWNGVLRDNWQDSARYHHARNLDLFGWAGEWIIRNRQFHLDMRKLPCRIATGRYAPIIECDYAEAIRRWGACCFELEGRQALCWLPERNPLVLKVEVRRPWSGSETFDFRHCPFLKVIVRMGTERLYVLLSDGARHLQLALSGIDPFSGPVVLTSTLCGMTEFETKSILLRRLSGLSRHNRFLRSLYPVERRAGRWMDMLRAWDGMEAGASRREICAALFGHRAAAEDWDAGYRTRVQRLVRGARRMVEGGYLELLRQV